MESSTRTECYNALIRANRAAIAALANYYYASARVCEAKLQTIDRGSPILDEEPAFAAVAEQRRWETEVSTTKRSYEAALDAYYDALQPEEE